MEINGKALKCIDCGSINLVEYNGSLLVCEECGQFFDTTKDINQQPNNESEVE